MVPVRGKKDARPPFSDVGLTASIAETFVEPELRNQRRSPQDGQRSAIQREVSNAAVSSGYHDQRANFVVAEFKVCP